MSFKQSGIQESKTIISSKQDYVSFTGIFAQVFKKEYPASMALKSLGTFLLELLLLQTEIHGAL